MVNLEAEQKVIKHLWAHPNNFADLSEKIRSEFFADPTCLAIWQAVSKSFVNNPETNEITVRQYLSPTIDLSWVAEDPPSKPDVYINIVRSNYMRREFSALVERSAERIKDPQTPPEFVVSDTGARILDLTMLDAEKKPTDFKSVLHRGLAFIKANHAAAQTNSLVGIDLISDELNSLTGGARKKEATYIAGRPGMGKTGYAMNIIVRNCYVHRKRGLFISMEMSDDVCCERFLSIHFDVGANRLHTGFIRRQEVEAMYKPIYCRSCGSTSISQKIVMKDWDISSTCRDCQSSDILHAIEQFAEESMPLDIDDRSGLSGTQIVARIKAHKMRHPDLEFVVIDYLNMVPTHGDKRANDLGEVCRMLREAAKSIAVAVIILAQLNRDLEKRQDRRPTLADFKETGGTEESADTVIFVYRDSYYDRSSFPTIVDTELIVAKQRNGPVGTGHVIYNMESHSITSQEKANADNQSHDH